MTARRRGWRWSTRRSCAPIFGGENPIGRSIGIGPAAADRSRSSASPPTRNTPSCAAPTPATIYLPAFQRLDGTANFAVRLRLAASRRATTDVAAVLSAIRAAVRDDRSGAAGAEPADAGRADRSAARAGAAVRPALRILWLLAVALAVYRLYGLMSHAVIQRTGEIGLRMALGAAPARVLRMILRESVVLVCLGIVVGLAAAYRLRPCS